MSSNIYYLVIKPQDHQTIDDLSFKRAMQEKEGIGFDRQFTKEDISWFHGLKCAGIEDADKIIYILSELDDDEYLRLWEAD